MAPQSEGQFRPTAHDSIDRKTRNELYEIFIDRRVQLWC